MSIKSARKVVVLADPSLHGIREYIRGVAEWSNRHAHWRISLQEGRADEQAIDFVNADGVLVLLPDLALARKVHRLRIPFVLSDPIASDPKRLGALASLPTVRLDSHAIGRLAAEHFLGRRYTSFAYVAETSNLSWSNERRRGFAETLARAGYDCVVYDGFSAAERRDWLTERPRMTDWLRTLPKPSAVFAAMDGRARLVLDACAEAGINVPNEIAVLGVDNDPVLCEAASPRLSSIRTGDFDSGCTAAKMLDALMDGRRLKNSQVTIGPCSVVTRESTGFDAMRIPTLAKAFAYIREHAPTENIDVNDVVSVMGCSRRYAEKLFADRVGRTLKSEILRVRFERVRELLRDTNLPLSAIAEQCGFPCESQLSFRFSKLFGCTATAWRRNAGTN